MRCALIGLTILAGFASLSNAADPAPTAPQPMRIVVPATPSAPAPTGPTIVKQGHFDPQYLPPGAIPAPGPYPVKHEAARFKFLAKRAYHNHEPDGVPTPVGESSLYTEFKFAFGSARQFFGTADAAEGHLRRTYVPGPNRYGP